MINVHQGEIVPAGTTLLQIVSQNSFEVNLGIESEDIRQLKVDQGVSLSSVYESASPKVVGNIRKLSYALNPTSRLVDIFVTLPVSSSFLLGELVLGNIEIASARGMVIPRTAVLQEGDQFYVFTVKNSRAVKHLVVVGIQDSEEVAISAASLSADDDVVVLGNYELSEGMKVRIEDM